MDLTDRYQLTEYLKSHRIWLDKNSGQHFLIDGSVLGKIIQSAGLQPSDTVLEIGPGVGTLTRALAQQVPEGMVFAVERDFKLAETLTGEFKGVNNVTIIHQDILEFDLAYKLANTPYKLVANIPYQISGAILRKFLDPRQAHQPSQLVLMVQKEVAQRWSAPVGDADRGIPTVLVELFGKAKIVTFVGRQQFFPEPEVDSAVIQIDRDQRYSPEESLAILHLAKIGFAAKRRTLVNALAGGLAIPKTIANEWLAKINLSPLVRAEDLAVDQWWNLSKQITESVQ